MDGYTWSASCTGPLYCWGYSPQYLLHRRLGEPQSQSGHSIEDNIPCLIQELNLIRSVRNMLTN
jgi:hypothetical protein